MVHPMQDSQTTEKNYVRLSKVVFALCLILQAFAFYAAKSRQSLKGDEVYYVHKSSYFVKHHRLPPPGAEHFQALHGQIGAAADSRPPGYPLVLALLGITEETSAPRKIWISSIHYTSLTEP